MPDDNKFSNDLLARVLAVILTAVSMIYASLSSSDRFTGAQGAVHEQRILQLEKAVDNLPPIWLRRDIEKISARQELILGRLQEIETHLASDDAADRRKQP